MKVHSGDWLTAMVMYRRQYITESVVSVYDQSIVDLNFDGRRSVRVWRVSLQASTTIQHNSRPCSIQSNDSPFLETVRVCGSIGDVVPDWMGVGNVQSAWRVIKCVDGSLLSRSAAEAEPVKAVAASRPGGWVHKSVHWADAKVQTTHSALLSSRPSNVNVFTVRSRIP